MEQMLSFIVTIVICTLAIEYDKPIIFLLGFIGGCAYHIIRGRKMGWKLPKDIKDTH